jgi:hypothetical protein
MSGAVGGIAEKMTGLALGAATGGMALLGTKTIGAGASALMNSKLGQGLKDSNNFASRMALKGLDKTSKASFDARNSNTFKSITSQIGSQTGTKIDYNQGIKTRKDGFQGAVDRNTKQDEDYAKMVTKDMPEITDTHIQTERTRIDRDLARRQTQIADLTNNNIPTDPAAFEARRVEIARLEAERVEVEKRKNLNNDKLKKELEKEQKDARLEIHAKAAEKSILTGMIGGKGARKAAAKAVRKLKGEKSAADQLRDLQKKQAEEDAAAGINQPAAAPAAANPAPAPAVPPPPVNPPVTP